MPQIHYIYNYSSVRKQKKKNVCKILNKTGSRCINIYILSEYQLRFDGNYIAFYLFIIFFDDDEIEDSDS